MKKNLLLLTTILLLCGCNGTPTTPITPSNENTSTTSQIVGDNNDGFKLRMFGELRINTIRTIYAELDDYQGQEILWTSSNPDIIKVSPRDGLTTECSLVCKDVGEATIVAQDSLNPARKVYKTFIIEEGEAMPKELFNKMTGGLKLTSNDKCIVYDDKYNPTVEEEYNVVTIYEENNPSDDVNNLNDAYQLTLTGVNNKENLSYKFVKGTGEYVCTEYVNYNNEVKHHKVLNEDEAGIKWESSYYCNLWRIPELITNEVFRSTDGGKTYHYSSYYLPPIYLCASMYLLDISPDDLYFVVKDNQELELHVEIDPYSSDTSKPKTGRKIISKISDINTAKIDHLQPYSRNDIHTKIDDARQKMASLKNYKAKITMDYPTGSDYRYDFIFTDDTIDVITYKDNSLHYHEGCHKKDSSSYYTYLYNDTSNQLTIQKTISQAWEAVNRYPTFDFASEIFKEVETNKYETIGNQGMFLQMCAYLSEGFVVYTFEDRGYLEMTDDGYISKISTVVNALGERLKITIEYSNYNNAKCEIDFNNITESNLPTSFKEAEPQLYSNMVDWKIDEVVPYLYSSVGYSTSVFYRRLDDHTGVKYAYLNTNAFPNNEERDAFIDSYKQLLIREGFVETTKVQEDTGHTLYQKGDYYLGVGVSLNWNGKETQKVEIIIVSDLLEPVNYA